MPFTLTMPKLSPTMDNGTIVNWHKKEGEFVEAGEVLFEVATDKATVEYQAIDSGWLRKILVEKDQEATVNQPVAIFTEEADESIENYQVPAQPSTTMTEQQEQPISTPISEPTTKEPRKTANLEAAIFTPEPPLEKYVFEFPREQLEKKVRASPLAKKLAKERGLNLSSIKGTGPNQRIMSQDLEKAQPDSLLTFGRYEKPTIAPGSYEEQSLSPMRKVISQRLQEAKTFIPHFYARQEVNAESLLMVREQLKQGGIKASVNDFIIRACALTLRQHPGINVGFNSNNQTIIQFKTIDIAMAVSIENGLITPILRHADFKNLGELAVESKLLAQKARDGKLEAHEYKGGSFTISNLGMYGVTDFQAIINPPQAAILAVSGIKEAPVAKNGSIVVGKTMNLTLSVDHRAIDGVAAALFLNQLKSYIENPVLLII